MAKANDNAADELESVFIGLIGDIKFCVAACANTIANAVYENAKDIKFRRSKKKKGVVVSIATLRL